MKTMNKMRENWGEWFSRFRYFNRMGRLPGRTSHLVKAWDLIMPQGSLWLTGENDINTVVTFGSLDSQMVDFLKKYFY